METSIFPKNYSLSLARYGALVNGFNFVLRAGYQVCVGKNNSGKSSFLQFVFRCAYSTTEIGSNGLCYIPSDRDYIEQTIQLNEDLGVHNSKLFSGVLEERTLAHLYHEGGLPSNALYKLLLNHTDLKSQINALDKLLFKLGFGEVSYVGNQSIYSESVPVWFAGSGNINLLPILAALTDKKLKVILIDEPERGLEPQIQKKLRDLLITESKDKAIIVSTHSHLFLNKELPENNFKISKDFKGIEVLRNFRDLQDVTFDLLGNSFEDLYLPGNYLVVEGSADEEICNKVLELKGIPAGKVKVLAAGGISKVSGQISAVCEVLRPVAIGDSPYSQTVVALIDKPEDNSAVVSAKEIAKCLNGTGRYFELDTSSLEEYLYNQNIIDEEELALVTSVEGKDEELAKTSLSKIVAARLTIDDLEKIPIIVKAVEKAIEKLEPVGD